MATVATVSLCTITTVQNFKKKKKRGSINQYGTVETLTLFIWLITIIFFGAELKTIVNVNQHTTSTCFRPIIMGIASWTLLMKK